MVQGRQEGATVATGQLPFVESRLPASRSVTVAPQDNINAVEAKGEPSESQSCPVAQAIRRQWNEDDVHVGALEVGAGALDYSMPEKLVAAVKAWDIDREPVLGTFILKRK